MFSAYVCFTQEVLLRNGAAHLLLIGNALRVCSLTVNYRGVWFVAVGYLFSVMQPICRGYAYSELVQVV